MDCLALSFGQHSQVCSQADSLFTCHAVAFWDRLSNPVGKWNKFAAWVQAYSTSYSPFLGESDVVYAGEGHQIENACVLWDGCA